MSGTTTQASSKKPKRLHNKCCCDWSECRAWQKAFTFTAENDIRGGDVKVLDLSGDDEGSTKLRNSVLDNIFKDRKKASGIKDLRRVYVAKHHWTVEQLEFLKRTRKRPTTPVDIATLRAMVRVVDPKHSYTPKGRSSKLYFNTPNNTIEDVKAAVEDLDSDRSSRSARRKEAQMQQEAALKQQQEEKERQRFSLVPCLLKSIVRNVMLCLMRLRVYDR